MSYLHAMFEAEMEERQALVNATSWLTALDPDTRTVVRDILAARGDFASLASLRMTCTQEDTEQYNWFQMMPAHPRCSWGVVDTPGHSIICLVRPRNLFYTCAMSAGHPKLAAWGLAHGYEGPGPLDSAPNMSDQYAWWE